MFHACCPSVRAQALDATEQSKAALTLIESAAATERGDAFAFGGTRQR